MWIMWPVLPTKIKICPLVPHFPRMCSRRWVLSQTLASITTREWVIWNRIVYNSQDSRSVLILSCGLSLSLSVFQITLCDEFLEIFYNSCFPHACYLLGPSEAPLFNRNIFLQPRSVDIECEIWSFHGGENSSRILLGFYAVVNCYNLMCWSTWILHNMKSWVWLFSVERKHIKLWSWMHLLCIWE